MKARLLPPLSATLLLLSGCAAFHCAPCGRSQEHNASSLVAFLDPGNSAAPASRATPQLHLPLRVGLAFLPDNPGGRPVLDDAHKQALLERVRAQFLSRPFVADITLIPDYYLTGARGVAGLQALQRLYSVDVVALISYDQVAYNSDSPLSFGYLTILGAYVLKGTRNDVTTLVDLAVVDPATRALVLRAGGIDTQHGSSTYIDQQRESRALRVASFDAATESMIGNFDIALRDFATRVREGRSDVRVVNPGGGAGAVDGLAIGLLLGAVILRGSMNREPA